VRPFSLLLEQESCAFKFYLKQGLGCELVTTLRERFLPTVPRWGGWGAGRSGESLTGAPRNSVCPWRTSSFPDGLKSPHLPVPNPLGRAKGPLPQNWQTWRARGGEKLDSHLSKSRSHFHAAKSDLF
jgi:hypothetical protein